MYKTGTQFNFLNRLHQMPTSEADLDLFRTESGDYSPDVHTLNRWEKEVEKKEIILKI